MKHHFVRFILTAVAMIISASVAFAETNTVNKTAAKSKATAKVVIKHSAVKEKAKDKVKLVDINSASKPQLMKLPGVSAFYADKIIAGRPYGSKAQLATRNVVPAGIYPGVAALVIAKQPFAESEKNAAVLSRAKK